jgi:hypothetical protein
LRSAIMATRWMSAPPSIDDLQIRMSAGRTVSRLHF